MFVLILFACCLTLYVIYLFNPINLPSLNYINTFHFMHMVLFFLILSSLNASSQHFTGCLSDSLTTPKLRTFSDIPATMPCPLTNEISSAFSSIINRISYLHLFISDMPDNDSCSNDSDTSLDNEIQTSINNITVYTKSYPNNIINKINKTNDKFIDMHNAIINELINESINNLTELLTDSQILNQAIQIIEKAANTIKNKTNKINEELINEVKQMIKRDTTAAIHKIKEDSETLQELEMEKNNEKEKKKYTEYKQNIEEEINKITNEIKQIENRLIKRIACIKEYGKIITNPMMCK